MNTAVTGTNEAALRDVLDRWKAGVDAHDPDRVAAAFTQTPAPMPLPKGDRATSPGAR